MKNGFFFIFFRDRYLGLQKTRDYHGTVEFKLGGEIYLHHIRQKKQTPEKTSNFQILECLRYFCVTQ